MFTIKNKMRIMEQLNIFISLIVSCNIKIKLNIILKKYLKLNLKI